MTTLTEESFAPDDLEEGVSLQLDFSKLAKVAQTGASVSLGQYRGQPLLLFFCDSVHSRGCTSLVKRLTSQWAELRSTEAGVLGVARDYRARVREAAYDLRLPFYVLADPDGRVFGAFGLEQGGSVFVVDAEGEIQRRLTGAPLVTLGDQALDLLPAAGRRKG